MASLLDKRDDEREEGEINTAGLADISFLLLIFFLITTTFDTDTGIGMTLPPPLPENQQPPPVKDRNMLKVLVNARGQVLIEEEASSMEDISREVKTHVLNRGKNPEYSQTPDDALVSIKTDRSTSYKMYINALDEVKATYNEIYNKHAKEQGFESYQAYKESLEPDEDDMIREKIPLNISIAEPSSRGGGGGGGSSS
jgi:biopolymer transport protein ExbD